MFRYHKILLFIFGLITLQMPSISAHEHWIDLDHYYPAVGEEVVISLCSGHHYPKSEIALKDRVLHDTEIILPDGKIKTFETAMKENNRSAVSGFSEAGPHIVRFTLRQPGMEEPMFQAKSIMVVGGGENDKERYVLGKGLEIVPGGRLSALRKGDTMTLSALYNGAPVKSELEIIPEKGKQISLPASPEQPALLEIKTAGRYLVSTDYEGKGCSLTFFVQEPKKP